MSRPNYASTISRERSGGLAILPSMKALTHLQLVHVLRMMSQPFQMVQMCQTSILRLRAAARLLECRYLSEICLQKIRTSSPSCGINAGSSNALVPESIFTSTVTNAALMHRRWLMALLRVSSASYVDSRHTMRSATHRTLVLLEPISGTFVERLR